MRKSAGVLLVALTTTLSACADDTGRDDRVTVTGYAHAGPMCPVESVPPDPACADRAVAGAVILVINSVGVTVAEPVTGEDGRFTVALAAGEYRFVPQPVEGLQVHHMDVMGRIAAERNIRLAIVAVPAASAQPVADALVAAGIEGILNFAPVTLTLPKHVRVVGVDLAIELEQLSFAVVNQVSKS